jgi:general secretion pathway protein I
MRTRNRGFTLIEVLAAVAVVALALGAIITTGSQSARNALYLKEKTIATWVARNRLAELHITSAWPAIGRSDGEAEMTGIKWHWRMEVKETPDPNVRRVEILVDAPGTKDNAIGQLVGYLSQPQAPASGPLPP